MAGGKMKQDARRTAMQVVQDVDLSGKVFIITGAYSGLGAATAKALLSAGARVIVTGRNPESLKDFAKELKTTTRADGSVCDAGLIDSSLTVDLADLATVRDFARGVQSNYDRVDCLINNAGVMNTPPGMTKQGFEIQMGTNVIGHFLLAKNLAGNTKRQVWLSSKGHTIFGPPPFGNDLAKARRIDLDAITKVDEKSYNGWQRYQQSKLGDILLAKQFPIEYSHMIACSVHPGIVQTNLARHTSIWSLLRFIIAMPFGGERPVSPEVGASTQTLCAVMPEEELASGAYYADRAVSDDVADCAKRTDDAKKLYDYCDEVTRPFQG